MSVHSIAVLGSGSYGTCLAMLLGRKGHDVRLWSRSQDMCRQIHETRENQVYLPGYKLPDTVSVTTSLQTAVSGARIVLGVTPSHAIRDVLGHAAPHLAEGVVVVNASKGLEEGTLARIDCPPVNDLAELTALDVEARHIASELTRELVH